MRLMFAAAAVLCLAACQAEQPGGPPADASAVVEAEAPSIPTPPPGEAQIPEEIVRALYAAPTIPTDAASIRKYFTEEFVPGLTPPDGEVGLVDFDYRINGQDGSAQGLALEEIAGGPTGGVVAARFINGTPQEIVWTVCRQPDGRLRIVEASKAGPEGWSLRGLLRLPARAEGC